MDISEDVIESDQDRDIIYYKMNNKWIPKNNLTENGINYSNYRSLLGQSIILDGKTVTIESIAPYAILQKAVTKEQLDSIERIYIDYEPTNGYMFNNNPQLLDYVLMRLSKLTSQFYGIKLVIMIMIILIKYDEINRELGL